MPISFIGRVIFQLDDNNNAVLGGVQCCLLSKYDKSQDVHKVALS